MFSAAMHRHTTAVREGKPPPMFGQLPAPERIIQQAKAAAATNRVDAFRPVLLAELQAMQMLVARHAREQAGALQPDTAKAAALAEELRPSLEFMQAVAALNYDEVQVCWGAFNGVPLTDEQRAVFDRYKPLAAWRAKWEAAAEAKDRQAAEQREREARDRNAARPAALIAEIQRRGVELNVDRAGNITALPATHVMPGEIEEIREHKAAIVALLNAPKPQHAAAPPRPLVIA